MTEAKPPEITIVFQARPGIDVTRSLRRLLKIALRCCGMRAVKLAMDPPEFSRRREKPIGADRIGK
jgi:hypothetical protein